MTPTLAELALLITQRHGLVIQPDEAARFARDMYQRGRVDAVLEFSARPLGDIPAPKIGQVWVSLNKRVEPRTVVEIGPHQWWPGMQCVHHVIGQRDALDTKFPKVLPLQSWRSWAKKSGARPVTV